jgi:hypothetical protein
VRDAAGLASRGEIEIEFRDGRIVIEPATVPMRVIERQGRATVEAEAEMPLLTSDTARDVLERIRR